jgi:hypothetical protein
MHYPKSENKGFIITQTQDTCRQRKPSFEEVETEDDLGALNYFSWLYGNVSDY